MWPESLRASPPESPSDRTLTLLFSSEEVILAEDETDVEQRHPFDGNCSEPSMTAGPRGAGLAGAGQVTRSRGYNRPGQEAI